MAGVAARAGTSKAVLYRRWPAKPDLVKAVIERRIPRLDHPACTGDLRADTLALLDSLASSYRGLQIISGLDPDLTAHLRHSAAAAAASRLTSIVATAGYDPAAIGPRILRLPADLLHLNVFNSSQPLDPTEIVDEIFLPLLHLRSTRDPTP